MNNRNQFRLGSLAALLVLSAAAEGQAGTVVKHRKLSEVLGTYPGGLDPDDQMGRAVICAGDIDGDGNVDLVSGAVGDDDGGVLGLDSDTGALWVHFMTSNGRDRENAKISATSGNFLPPLATRDQLGRALAPLGDFDGDGVPDIAAGCCRDDDGGVNRGAVYLLFLNRDGSVKDTRKISDTAGGFTGGLEDLDEFGRAIANLGDLDGDGVIDLAVGATGDDDGGVDLKGAIWILFMNADGTVKAHQKISDTAGNFTGAIGGGDLLGFSLTPLGDLDGDGVMDIATGCPKDDDGGVKKGAVWILFLNADGTVKTHYKISDKANGYGLTAGDEFGTSVAGLGDLDGDGLPDLAIGAILDEGGFHDAGAVWINFLNADGSVRAKQRINAVEGNFQGKLAANDWFGSSVATIPDLDGDGRIELAVGARFDDDGGINTGSVWILSLDGQQNVAPLVGFEAAPTDGFGPLLVNFSSKSSAGALTFDWDFGDGATSTVASPSHVYTQPGLYTVALTVGGPGGQATLERDGLVLVRTLATVAMRNGSGVNRVGYTSATLPILGTTWTAEIDATPHAGAGLTYVLGTAEGLTGPILSAGQLLLRMPAQGGALLLRTGKASGGAIAQHAIGIPSDPSLVGLQVFTQGLILGGYLELTNALDLTLGF
jgi:hypothetical protein